MSFSVRYAPAVLLTVISFAISICAQTTPKPNPKAARGSISGRVMIKERGAPGVAIGFRKGDGSMPMPPFETFSKVMTDGDGVYRITNLAPGSYEIVASAPGYVVPGPTNSKTKNVLVGEDENVEGINFSLVRGGVITGRVTDADGKPVIQQQVHVYKNEIFNQNQRQPGQQNPAFYPFITVQTDDRGIYRVYGLPAGRYKIGAGRSDETFAGPSMSRHNYRQVFHPDATEHAKATIIEASEGSEAKDVNIALGSAIETFSVSGRVIDDKGMPVPHIRFMFQRIVSQRPEFTNSMVVSDTQGDFFGEGLIPGKYGLYIMQGSNPELRAETITFDVLDQDVSGLTVKLVRGAVVSGVVALETEDKTAFEKLTKLHVRGFVSTGSGASSVSPIGPDGSFRLTGLPAGTLNFLLSGATGPSMIPGFVLTRIEREGVVLPRGLEIKEGEQLGGIRVVVAYGTATLRGQVKVENGSLPEGAQITVRILRNADHGSNLRPVTNRPPVVDARGYFVVENLPPGVYEVSAFIAGGGPIPQQPHNMKREVHVQDGVVNEVVITIDMGAPRP